MPSTPSTPKSTRRERWAWYMYDFGNSAYAAVVLMAVYSTYFKDEVVGGAQGSFLWGLSVGIAMLVVALTSPILGAIADFSGSKKRFLLFYTAMSCLFTVALFFATEGAVLIGMTAFILAEIGYRSAQVFYNSLLPEIAAPEEIGRISGTGWAVGSAGGIVCLLLILPLIVIIEGTFIVRVSLVITAIYFVISAIPLFLWLPERAQAQKLPEGETYLSVGLKQLRRTIRTASRFREFLKFMLAFLIYNDGVIMALDFAAIIGAVLYGMEQEMLILFVIVVQVTNMIGAYVFGILTDRMGGKRALVFSLWMMIGLVVCLFFNQSQELYFVIGAGAGFAMAGLQSISRTMVGMFSPPGQSAEFYGFFSVAGRTSSFIGPAVYGIVAGLAARWYESGGRTEDLAEQLGQRIAILVIALFLLVGLILLRFVDEAQAQAAAVSAEEAGAV